MIGEKLTQNVANDWGRNLRAYNTYGPAETTVVSTLRQFRGADDPIPSSNVGLPMPSVTAVVMRGGSPVVRGESGELALGGPQLSHGYWKDSTKTSEKFVWNPHMSMTLYMTGDMVRTLEDGSMDFIGRTDDLIKVQGIRIELSEIAFSLRACHPMVQQVEVQYLNRSDRPANVIVAFLAAPHLSAPENFLIMSGEAASISKAALAQAREQLPDYMIPRVFLVLKSIPRTSSAKIDRTCLKAHYESANLVAWEKQVAPSKVGDLIRDEWTEEELLILKSIVHISGTSLAAVGRDSTLASIGIDSIAATRLAPTLNAKGSNISIAAILQCETLQDLLTVEIRGPEKADLNTFDAEGFDQTWRQVVARDIVTELAFVSPALPLQEALLTEGLQRVDAYWSNNVYTLEPNVDLTRLQKAWERVASMTGALRMAFFPTARLPDSSNIDSTFLQLIHEDHDIDWKVVDSSEALFQQDSSSRSDTIAQRRQSDQFMVPPWAVTVYALECRRVMILTIHHSLRDDLSLSFMLADLKIAYIDPGLIQPRHQLKDALRILLPTTAQRKRDQEYWTKRLTSFSATEESRSWPPLLKGSDESRGSSVVSRTKMKISYTALKTSAISVGTSSVASLLRFAWSCILCQYLETDRIVFGETLSARNDDPSLRDVVGPLISVLPVPFHRAGAAITALRQQIERAEDISHAKLHPRTARSILGVEDGQPLYLAMYNFMADSTLHLDDQKPALWRSTGKDAGLAVEHPMALNVSISAEDEVLLELNASHGIADRAHLQVLAQQIEALVEVVIKNTEDSVSDLCSQLPSSLMSITPLDRYAVKNEAREQSPTHWVDYHAKHYPDWPAAQVASIIKEDELASDCWSYGQLHDAYTAVTAKIIAANVTRRNIAVCLSRQLDVYAILLAIMKTGNTYLPIAEDLPMERRAFMLRDSNAALIFTSGAVLADFNSIPSDCKHILVNDSLYQVKYEHEQVAVPRPSDNAYLLYTSGSTGTPKGVLVSRGNLTSFIEAASKFMHRHVDGMHELRGKGRYLGFASFAFDVHLKEMFAAWRHGMAVVTAPRTMLLDDLELALQKLKITHASFVPSLVDSMGLEPDMVPDLRYMSVGGEMLSRRIIDKWAGNERVTVVNAYGPTEATIGCCFTKVTKGINVRNIGPPLAFTTAHVLKPGTTQRVMRGVAGELCLTGNLIANGYLNRPEARGFVEDFQGERIYRTGDRARLMADGTLEFLGRDDDQTKIRGQRLELGEVSEAVRASAKHISQSANADAAAMLALNPLLRKKQLVAFVTIPINGSGSSTPTRIVRQAALDGRIEEIRTACHKSLPAFMVPDHVIPITNLPLVLSSRKIDMKLLSALFSDYVDGDSRPLSEPHEVSPRMLSETESSVLTITKSVLRSMTDDIPPMTSLFRQGLDSLSAISLAVKLQKAGYQCTVTDVLKNPSIEKLASLPHNQLSEDRPLAAALHEFKGLETRFLQRGLRGLDLPRIVKIRPCLPLQETMIASSLDQCGATPYVNHVTFQLSSEVDVAKLRKAWEDTVADLEILRTCFQEFESRFVQIVLQNVPIGWERISMRPKSISLFSPDGHRKEIEIELLNSLSSKPPIRFTVVDSEDGDEAIFLISIHHALYDEESFYLMLNNAHDRYEGRPLSQTHASHDTFLAYVSSQDGTKAKQFWEGYLQEYKQPAIRDPVEQASPSMMETESKVVDSMPDLEEFASSMNTTPAAVLQSVFGIVLAQHDRRNDIVFGAVSSGRTIPIQDPHSIIAPCVVTMPQRLTINPAQSSAVDILRSATDGFFQSIQYQHTALRDIHRWIGAERPLFDCLFSYRQKRKPPPWAHLWWELDSSMITGFPFAVEVEADREAGHVLARATATAGFGDRKEVESFLESMQMLLQALMSHEPVNLDELGFADSGDADPENLDEDAWSEVELQIRDIASDMTGIERHAISKGASFFRLGIDSISAIRFARDLRAQGFECSSADVIRCASIAKLSSYIQSSQQRADTISEAPIGATVSYQANLGIDNTDEDGSLIYPCTPLQSSMLMQTLGSDGKLYANQHVFRLAPDVDLTRLRKAWEQLVMQTEILRTSFHLSDDGNVLLAKVRNYFSLPWQDWTGQLEMSAALTKFKADFCFQEASDYATPPWKLYIIGEYLVVSIHHSLYDGQSLSILFADLFKLYDNDPIPSRTAFSRAARVIAASGDDFVDYWTRSIRDYVGTRTQPNRDLMQRRHRVMAFETSIVSEDCRSIGVTLQSVALLAFAKSLACILGHRDMVTGHVVGGRSVPFADADEIVGPLFNTVPLRITLNKAYMSNGAAAREIQRLTGGAQSHQHASLGKIQQLWQSKRKQSEHELLNSIFVFQQQSDVKANPLWESIDLNDEEAAPTEYATNFEIEQGVDGINVQIASTQIQDLEAWLDDFENTLREILEQPHRPVLASPSGLRSIPLRPALSAAQDVSEDALTPGHDLTCLEHALTEVTRLEPGKILPDASIYSLGLDSLSAMKVAASCRQRGLHVTVGDILQGRSLHGIVQRLRQRKTENPAGNADHNPSAPPAASQNGGLTPESRSIALDSLNLRPTDVETVQPCLPGQFFHLTNWVRSGRTMGEATFLYKSAERLNPDKLRHAWNELRRCHPILRTAFVALSPSSCVQVILQDPTVNDDSFRYCDLAGDTSEDLNHLLRSIIASHFDMLTPPCEFHLLKTSAQDFVALKLHHALYDAYTITALVQDLIAIYKGVETAPTPTTEHILDIFRSPAPDTTFKSFWSDSLRDCQPTILYSKLHLQDHQPPPCFFTKRHIPHLHALSTLAQTHHLSINALLLTSFAAALSSHTNIPSPVFGFYQAGRSTLPTSSTPTSTPYLNILPLMLPNVSTTGIPASAHALQDHLAQRVGFEQSHLLDVMDTIGHGVGVPLFNALINILDSSSSSLSAAEEKGEELLIPYHLTDIAAANDTPSQRYEGENKRTALDGLETGFLAEENVYLDIIADSAEDRLELVMLCDSSAMARAEAEGFLGQIVRVVEAFG